MNVSIVVCTLNPNERYLVRCLDAIASQLPHGGRVECLIVDNGSETPVADLASVRGRDVRIVREERPGLTAARARGVAEAQYEVLIFVDDDNVLASDYVSAACTLFADLRIGALSGAVLPEYETPPPSWFLRFEEAIAVRRLPPDHLHLTAVPAFTSFFPIGAGLCIRRDVLRRYFAEYSDAQRIEGRIGDSLSSGEDIDIALAAIRWGFLVGSSGSLRLTHIIPPRRTTVRYVAALNRGSLRSCFQIDRKWRPVFGRPIFDYVDSGPLREIAKAAIYACTGFRPSSRVRFATHMELSRLLRKERARGAAAS